MGKKYLVCNILFSQSLLDDISVTGRDGVDRMQIEVFPVLIIMAEGTTARMMIYGEYVGRFAINSHYHPLSFAIIGRYQYTVVADYLPNLTKRKGSDTINESWHYSFPPVGAKRFSHGHGHRMDKNSTA